MIEVVRYADRPDLLDVRSEVLNTFPEYMNHNAMGWKYWGRLYDVFPAFQLALLDDGELVGEMHALAVQVEDELPAGWDEAFERGMERGGGNVLSLLAISIHPDWRGGALSARLIGAARDAAVAAGLTAVLAPVRPTLKAAYPLIPIDDYVGWRRADGSHFDPWIRVHERLGGAIVQTAPRSMTIEAPVADWEAWTGMALPADGTYVVPGMLAPLEVRGGVGLHIEPNVWLRHSPS